MESIIYIKIINEGTSVYRPVLSAMIDNDLYVVGKKDDDDELWEFEPGTIVEVESRLFKDGTIEKIATKKHKKVDNPPDLH